MLEIDELRQTSHGAPSQWDLKLKNGNNYHIRYRNFKLWISENDEELYHINLWSRGQGHEDIMLEEEMLLYVGYAIARRDAMPQGVKTGNDQS